MTNRLPLPNRRRCETFTLDFGGLSRPHTVSVGYYDDGRIGELFITGGKSGEQVQTIARDGAIMASLALQHGVTIDTMHHAITRNSQDEPQSVLGVVVDGLRGFEHIEPRRMCGAAIDRRISPITKDNGQWDVDAENHLAETEALQQ